MPSFSHIRPNCVAGSTPSHLSRSVGVRKYTFNQSVYSAPRHPVEPHPTLQHLRRRPGRLLLREQTLRHSCRVIHQVHQTRLRPPLF